MYFMHRIIHAAVCLFLCVATRGQAPAYPTAPAAPPNISRMEYVVISTYNGVDPGFGNGTALPITAQQNIVGANHSINLGALPEGIYYLLVRVQDATGKWSITNIDDPIAYLVIPAYPTAAPLENMVRLEYAWDGNTPYGSGTPIPLTPNTNLANQNIAINITGLSPGLKQLFIRSQDAAGRWSLNQLRVFNVGSPPGYPAAAPLENMVKAEYFIDTDPGPGNAIPIALTPGGNIQNLNISVDLSNVSPGTHTLFIRTQDARGKWSLTNYRSFNNGTAPAYAAAPAPPQNIIQAEYFINNDPGLGNGTPIPLVPGVDVSNIPISIPTAGLAVGQHYINVRSKAANGQWSLTNLRSFQVGTLTILPDSIVFPATILNIPNTRSLVVRNNSTTPQTITGVAVGAPFTSNFTGTRTVAPLSTDTVRIVFTPATAGLFEDTIRLETSADIYKIPVKGTAVAAIHSWTLAPATGHDYGNVPIGNNANFNFTIRNTGNTAIALLNATTGHPAFVPTFTAGTVIPVNGTLNLPVSFTPAANQGYSTTLTIRANSGGPDSVTTIVSGVGFTPAVPPTLTFVQAAPYSGLRGVNPAAGQAGNYTYKVLYRSAENRPPAAGFPKIGIDANGDRDFDDGGEGLFTMAPEGAGNDYVTGVVFTYTTNLSSYGNAYGYQFFANDNLGNAAVATNAGYNAGPSVSLQLVDLRLFANNISFSKTNLQPGETFTVTANISNAGALGATNVPVHILRDTVLIETTVLPSINGLGTATLSRTLSFGAEGFYPIKIWIDPNNTLGETNVLNNFAIRPVIVGNPALPGGITVTANARVQNCPGQKLVITGSAQYFGTGSQTTVAGAEVTINTGAAILKTATNSAGNFTLVVENPACGGNLTYTVSVTDFTFTSNTFTGAINIPCLAPGECAPPPVNGNIAIVPSIPPTPCATVVGSNISTQLTITYRGRNTANFWSSWDRIWKDTVKVFNNGQLIETFFTNDLPDFGSSATFPGDVKTFTVNVPLNTTGPNNITAVATYQYNEFFQIPSSTHQGVFTNMTATAGTTVVAFPDAADLIINGFTQTGFRSFRFNDANIECRTAGSHVVRVLNISGTPVELFQTTVSSLPGRSTVPINVSLPSLVPGTYRLRIVTDSTNQVTEINENNNAFETTIVVPQPDLIVDRIVPSSTNVAMGSAITFTATVSNSGVAAGAFEVQFLDGALPIGSNTGVPSIGEKGTVAVGSKVFNVLSDDKACPVPITAWADASGTIAESNENNNTRTIQFGTDITPVQQSGEFGTPGNPVVVRVNTAKRFNAYIRNLGTRDARDVTVRFVYNGQTIGSTVIPNVRAGEQLPSVASFDYTFTTAGNMVVNVTTDTANIACEINEGNNTAAYHVRVTESREDLQVLSQFISPSALNPNIGQSITIVGTVKNIGNRVAPSSSMRFYVDNIQLGNPVPFNALAIGADTTVAATAQYASQIPGIKVVKIAVDTEGLVAEESENNNEATRIIIVGDAPDMTRGMAQPIRFNPNGFRAGDSVTVSYAITNAGTSAGTAWARFKIFDMAGSLTALDSIAFTLASGDDVTVFRKMLFPLDSGFVVMEIANCTPQESNLLNNTDTLYFSTVVRLKANLIVNNLDLKEGLPTELPGWIGGKLMLGNFNLTVNGQIVNFDTSRFIVTNGTGKLLITNGSNQQIFPVGTSVFSSNFLKLNNSGVADNFSVRVVPYVLNAGFSGDTVRAGSVNRTWFIEEQVSGGSNVSLEMFWFGDHELSGFERVASSVAHFKGGWQVGPVGVATTDSILNRFSRQQGGFTNFSPFTVTSNGTVLPLQFLQVSAHAVGKQVEVNWITAGERNTSHFDIEFSSNGADFVKVGHVTALNTPGNNGYSFLHLPGGVGSRLLYRIRQVDLDGGFTLSKVVALEFDLLSIKPALYPNPASSEVVLSLPAAAEARGELWLTNLEGKQLWQRSVSRGTQQVRIDVRALPAGAYWLVLMLEGERVVLPLIKK